MDDSGFINLTEAGRDIAERIYERHQVLTHILIYLGVSPKHAEEDACKIEHDICEETFEALKNNICGCVPSGRKVSKNRGVPGEHVLFHRALCF